MKNIIKLFSSLFLGCGILFMNSCSNKGMDNSLPINPVMTPIKAVIAQDGPVTATADIDNDNKTISLKLKKSKPEDLKAVKINMSVSKRAKLISPTDTILTLDLTKPYQIVINNLYKDVTYTLTAMIPDTLFIDKSIFKEYKLNNDFREEGNIIWLWNNEIMTKPEDYDAIGYRNYCATECFTVDMGNYYHLCRFNANLYWAYTNVCPKKYQLLGYTGNGIPPIDGDWNNWTVLGTIDNSNSTLADFGTGDNLEFTKDKSPYVRYIRVRCLENYRNPPTTDISLCEIILWAYNL